MTMSAGENCWVLHFPMYLFARSSFQSLLIFYFLCLLRQKNAHRARGGPGPQAIHTCSAKGTVELCTHVTGNGSAGSRNSVICAFQANGDQHIQRRNMAGYDADQ